VWVITLGYYGSDRILNMEITWREMVSPFRLVPHSRSRFDLKPPPISAGSVHLDRWISIEVKLILVNYRRPFTWCWIIRQVWWRVFLIKKKGVSYRYFTAFEWIASWREGQERHDTRYIILCTHYRFISSGFGACRFLHLFAKTTEKVKTEEKKKVGWPRKIWGRWSVE
jgi:hypothetical protein